MCDICRLPKIMTALILLLALFASLKAEAQQQKASQTKQKAVPGARANDSFKDLAELGKFLEKEAMAERFSGVVMVVQEGKPVFHHAYGYASRRFKVRNKPDTKFNIGSINKMFTTVAIRQLEEKGLLELDDRIGKYLKDFPEKISEKVTINHLLSHQSGWGDYFTEEQYNARWRDLRKLDDYISFIREVPLQFEPGTSMQYSNIGFVVLGAVIESISGKSYYDYVRENIFKKAGMKSTDSYEMDVPIENLAIGYSGGGYNRNNHFLHSVRGTSAGGGFSTAEDLLCFAEALWDDVLLEPRTGKRMKSCALAGGAWGINSFLGIDEPKRAAVVVLSNFDPPTAMDLGMQIMEMMRATSYSKKEKIRAQSAPFQIGLGLKNINGVISVGYLRSGGSAERDGLKPDDVLLSINGDAIEKDTIAQIRRHLQSAAPITFRVQRGEEKLEIKVTPEKG